MCVCILGCDVKMHFFLWVAVTPLWKTLFRQPLSDFYEETHVQRSDPKSHSRVLAEAELKAQVSWPWVHVLPRAGFCVLNVSLSLFAAYHFFNRLSFDKTNKNFTQTLWNQPFYIRIPETLQSREETLGWTTHRNQSLPCILLQGLGVPKATPAKICSEGTICSRTRNN